MLGASATTTTTSTTCTSCVVNTHSNHDRPSNLPPPSDDPCNGSTENIRELPRQISDVRQRSAPISPASLDASSDPRESEPEHIAESGSEDGTDEPDEELASPWKCLICDDDFIREEDMDLGLELNLEHMQQVHGLFIPDQHSITDMEALLGFLATVVRVWHECLKCGAVRSSTRAVQSHMRDKGHFALNLERDQDLLAFWADSDDEEDTESTEAPKHLSHTEMQLPSGKLVESRSAEKKRRVKHETETSKTAMIPSNSRARGTSSAAVPTRASRTSPTEQGGNWGMSKAGESKDRRVGRRDAMGIIGISAQQQRALLSAEKRAQTQEAMAQRAQEGSFWKRANIQPYDLAHDRSFSKAKSGRHSMLPR